MPKSPVDEAIEMESYLSFVTGMVCIQYLVSDPERLAEFFKWERSELADNFEFKEGDPPDAPTREDMIIHMAILSMYARAAERRALSPEVINEVNAQYRRKASGGSST